MKIALCQLNAVVGDVNGNTDRIEEVIESTADKSPDLLVFPELFIQGYPPQDLLENDWFIARGLSALDRLLIISNRFPDTGIITGLSIPAIVPSGRGLYNSAVLIYQGRVLFHQNKSLLPTYDVFDEGRFFDPAPEISLIEFKGEKLGISICEDAWNSEEMYEQPLYDFDPVKKLAEMGASLLINISASPFYIGKKRRCFELMQNHAKRHKLPFVFVNMVGANDELVFDGSSMFFNAKGLLCHALPTFEEGVSVIDTSSPGKSLPEPDKDSIEDIYDALVLGVKDYTRKCGFKKAVIGLSGGIDSAVTCAISVKALGGKNVLGVNMPSAYSSQASIADSKTLAKNLGIELHTLPIKSLFDEFSTSLKNLFKGREEDVTEENIQARIRGNILMAISNKFKALLLSTGNKSESAVGYCTLYGDMSGGLGVISDVYKTKVYELAYYINRKRDIIPPSTLTKAPSAELKPNQKDQDTLPPYEILDPMLNLLIEDNLSIDQVIAKGFDKKDVLWVVKAMQNNEYKRRQAAPGLKITKKAFGSGRRFPIASNYSR